MNFFKKSKLLVMLALGVPVLLLAAACGASAPISPNEPPSKNETEAAEIGQESVVAVNFAKDLMTPDTIQVKQGDHVTLNLETDRPGSFHIHGYDLEREVGVGEVTQFQFVANATGRFRINFHGVDGPMSETAVSKDLGSGVAEAPMAGMEQSEGGTGDAGAPSLGAKDHGSMEHGPVESAAPVNLDISAEVDERGGIHVAISTEGWRWSPEEVNGANSDGAGHAHVYADGVKLSRVYGNYHYIPGLEPGIREIKVSLNTNDHSELTWQGDLLESVVAVTVPDVASISQDGKAPMMEAVDAGAPMSVEVNVHEDALGGYNVQVLTNGFEFSQSAGQRHEPGKGYARLSIDGEEFNRLYVPWLQVPAQGEGRHNFTVALMNSGGQLYQQNGKPVETSLTVLEEVKTGDGKGAVADHHETGSSQRATGSQPGSGPDAAAAAASDHHGGSGASDHDHGGATTAEGVEIVELEVGYLEVLP